MPGDLSAERNNRILGDIKREFREGVDKLRDEVMSDGYPPFTEPRPPREQLRVLEQMRATGDPRFFEDPQAQKDYDRLSKRYGG